MSRDSSGSDVRRTASSVSVAAVFVLPAVFFFITNFHHADLFLGFHFSGAYDIDPPCTVSRRDQSRCIYLGTVSVNMSEHWSFRSVLVELFGSINYSVFIKFNVSSSRFSLPSIFGLSSQQQYIILFVCPHLIHIHFIVILHLIYIHIVIICYILFTTVQFFMSFWIIIKNI